MKIPLRLRSCRFAVTGLSALALTGGALVAVPAQASVAAAHRWYIAKMIGTKDVFLEDMAAASASDTWLGGSQGSPDTSPVLDQLSHGKLKTVVAPGGSGVFVDDLSALSASDVWGTESNAPFVLHLGPRGWSRHSLAIGSDDILISGVVPVSTRSVWVLDYDFSTKTYYSYHYNGKTWSQRKLPYIIDADNDEGLVSGTSNSNLWGLSFSGPGAAANAVHYNGKKWLLTKFPVGLAPVGYTLYSKGIYAQSPTSVWATLYSSRFSKDKITYGPLILLHWNGKLWSKITGKLPKAVLQGPITSDGHGGLWMYGLTPNGLTGLLLHYSRGRWITDKEPTARASHEIVDVLGLALLPGTSTVQAAGNIAPNPGGDSGAAVLEYTP
jgi:hypothetical protein